MTEKELEEYWNNKHPQQPIIYKGRAIPNRSERVSIDVRKMFWAEDYILSDVVKQNNLKGSTIDETAWLCQKYIVENYKYVSDISSWNFNEFWQYCNETLAIKCGDCEDSSLLLCSLLCCAGVEEWRVRMNAGWVIDNAGQKMGHGYTTYCRSTDNNWVILDWCFLQDPSVPVSEKTLAKDNPRYSDIWFSFNSKYSWSYKQYDVFADIYNEPKTLFVD